MKILIIGDIHFKESRGYADYITDRRVSEQQEILDFIVEQGKDCDQIVFMGDSLNGRNNPSKVIKEFVKFIERFQDKQVYILRGNHEAFGDGRSAIDFLKEIYKKHWIVITGEIGHIPGIGMLVPYFTKAELNAKDNEAGAKILLQRIKNEKKESDKILFIHHAITGIETSSGGAVGFFNEIVLPKAQLEKQFKLVVGGHVHQPQQIGTTLVSGSIFNDEMGETGKSIWKIKEKFAIEEIKLPGRPIHKFENPTKEQLKKIPQNSIVKIVLTEKLEDGIEKIKKELKRFDAYILIEQYPHERKKAHFEEGMLEFSPEQLLEVYAKQRKVNFDKLKKGWELINLTT